MGWKQWVALAEIVLANLAWLDELDLEGWMVATGLAIGAGVAVWIFLGPVWLLVGATAYLALLLVVKVVANRGRNDGDPEAQGESRSRISR
ncbi:MAG: hypothetical protein U0R69_02840 [Gaiellales bacterium]